MTDQPAPEALAAHHLTLTERWAQALDATGFDSALLLAGEALPYFLDDQGAPFRPNPHFAQWFPSRDCEHSALFLRPGQKPRLLFVSPSDYWHQPPQLPAWAHTFEVEELGDAEAVDARAQALIDDPTRTAVIGEGGSDNFSGVRNPQALLDHLHFHRATKTTFELEAMRKASRRAAAGHTAAARAFRAGGSEFDIYLAYLGAVGQTPEELPYASIVALNEHAGVLHYQHYDRERPARAAGFLIDAGASAWGYAADVTRTYASDAGTFADLIGALDAAQQALIADIRPGQNYLELHEAMHRRLGDLLATHKLVTCSGEAAFAQGITRTFLPHGLGHLIGLQTHDVAGLQEDAGGTQRPPPAAYPALRLTREIGEDMVFTIEPGLYFIPQLLDALRQSPAGREVAWQAVEELIPCGGIRIEDNVRVVAQEGPENLTRDAFATVPDR